MACHHIRMPDGSMALLCGGRRGRRNPERCFYCGNEASFQCDHPVFRQNKKTTCDTWMCAGCSNPIGKDLDLCRSHFNLWRNSGNKFVLGGRGCGMNGRVWTEDENRKLFKLYADDRTEDIARLLGRSKSATYGQAKKLGLSKSPEFTAKFCRMQKGVRISNSTKFKKGHVPHNKGVRRPGWSPGRMKETQFRKGQRTGRANAVYKPVGAERITREGYLERKINDDMPFNRRWRAVHLINWELIHGPIPKGHVLAFRNGNPRDIAPENLELITRGELMLRNTIHHLPSDLKDTIQLAGRVKRAIRKRVKNDASQKQP